MKKYIVFGAGKYGRLLVEWVASDIAFFLDNDSDKWGTTIKGIPIYSIQEKKEYLNEYSVIIATKNEYEREIMQKLKEYGVSEYISFNQFEHMLIEERIKECSDNIEIYNKAISWIHNHTIDGEGIINNTAQPYAYPEVTGYYIPTLMCWGYKEIAFSYAKWLCDIQKEDGSFYGTGDDAPYIFDTAQIIKGLLAVRNEMPWVKEKILKACDWILEHMDKKGRLLACDESVWGNGETLSELIHIYCLSPILEAGKVYNNSHYIEMANKSVQYYLSNNELEINSFSLLSHFQAYVIEGLIDMGKIDAAKNALKVVEQLMDLMGVVPAYREVKWVCSTGLFQFAVIWFRLGDVSRGEKAFQYACKLQNTSGGWYGSYATEYSADEELGYLPTAEISWANKYFLDALRYRSKAIFDTRGEFFIDHVDRDSSTYRSVYTAINSIKETSDNRLRIADVGCGRGSYLKNLIEDFPEEDYYAIDISEKVMGYFDDNKISKHIGSLTCIPFEDSFFDITYACESLEHAVEINNSIKEMARVTKPGGTILVIDKHMDTMGEYVIEEWEQFFDEEELKNVMETYCTSVHVEHGIGHTADSMVMSCWVGEVK